MKKNALLTVLVFLVFLAGVSAANDNYFINPDGSVQAMPSSLRPASPEEAQAIANPGLEVPFDLQSEEFKRIDFFHGIAINKYSRLVTYADGKITTIEKNVVIEEREPFIMPHIVLTLVSMASMAIVVVLFICMFFFDSAAITAAFAAVAAITAAVAAIATTFAAASIAAFLAATIPVVLEYNNRIIWLAVVVYYLLTVAVLLA